MGCAFRKYDPAMGPDVIAVGMRNEREFFCVRGIEPKILPWQKNAALVKNVDHSANLVVNCVKWKRWGRLCRYHQRSCDH